MIMHVTVQTAQLAQTVEFYQWLLGLPIARQINTPSGEIVFLGENETKIEFIGDSNAERINSKAISIGFKVDSLDDKMALLDSKQITYSDIIAPTPYFRFIFFTDLNGCQIQLLEVKQPS